MNDNASPEPIEGSARAMSDLYPTPSRVALLQDIADGLVVEADTAAWRDEALAAFYDPFTATRTKVTARVREMVAAGWVEHDTATGMYWPTDAGRAVIEAVRPAKEN